MKQLIVFLTLFISASFYAQDEVFEEPVEVEGFYKYEEDNSVFYELYEGRVMAPVWFNIKHSVELPDNFQNTGLIKVKGKRRKGGRYGTYDFDYREEIVADKVLWAKDVLLEDYLKKQSKEKSILSEPDGGEKIEYFEEEGFYSKGLEHSFFSILRNDSLVGGSGCLYFDMYIQEYLKDITYHRYPRMKKGVYMKIKGIKISGKGFGHYGPGNNYQVMVSKVEALDRTRTRWAYIAEKVQKEGSCNVLDFEFVFHDTYKEGKEYFFTGKDSIYNCEMRLVRNGGYINYNFKCFKGSKKKSDFSGKVVLTEYKVKGDTEGDYDYDPGRHEYESMDDVYKTGESKFEIMVMENKDELGRFVIEVKDGITKDYEERYFVLYEKLN